MQLFVRSRCVRRPCVVALVALAPLIGACSTDLGSVNVLPSTGALTQNWLSFAGQSRDFTQPAPTPDQLIGAEGQCAGFAPDPAGADSDAVNPALVQGGVSLQMAECDVVRRIGTPEKVDFGPRERGERTVVLTYIRGVRPGIYTFSGGRLVSIERAPEPPAPAKPVKPAPKKSGRA